MQERIKFIKLQLFVRITMPPRRKITSAPHKTNMTNRPKRPADVSMVPDSRTDVILSHLGVEFKQTDNPPKVSGILKEFRKRTGQQARSLEQVFDYFNVPAEERQKLSAQTKGIPNPKFRAPNTEEERTAVRLIMKDEMALAGAKLVCYGTDAYNPSHDFKTYPLIRLALISKGLLQQEIMKKTG
ncbi:MAG: hypothetical protein Q7K42_04320 [Candidatus Diapherotrites archaeon]|nr:hypothetical protein [Candidatus Diapherotrites archaeon]